MDITEILANLNLHLQGKDQLCSSMFDRITSFTKKLELFIAQLKAGEIVHFRSLSERVQNSSVNYEKYAKLCEDLLEEFTIRFSDFKKIEIELKLFSDPFSFFTCYVILTFLTFTCFRKIFVHNACFLCIRLTMNNCTH